MLPDNGDEVTVLTVGLMLSKLLFLDGTATGDAVK